MVRQSSAKALFPGSNPGVASKTRNPAVIETAGFPFYINGFLVLLVCKIFPFRELRVSKISIISDHFANENANDSVDKKSPDSQYRVDCRGILSFDHLQALVYASVPRSIFQGLLLNASSS